MSLPKFKIKLGNLGGAAQPQSSQQDQPAPHAPPSQQQQLPATSGASHGVAGTSTAPPPAGGLKIKVKLGNAPSLASAGSLQPQGSLLGKTGIKRPAGTGPLHGRKKPKLAKPPGTGKPGRPPGTGGPKRKRIKTDFGAPLPEFAPPDAGFASPFQPLAGGGIGGPAPKLKLKVTASNLQQPKMPMNHIPGMPPPRRRGRPPKNPQNMGDRPPKAEDDVSFNVNIQPREYALRNIASTAALNEDDVGLHMEHRSLAQPAQVEIIVVDRQPRKEDFDRILTRVTEKDVQGVFKKPVTNDEAPNYSEIIKEPMDLSTMRTKHEAEEYKTWEAFEKDLLLIFENALTYNVNGDQVWKYANRLRTQSIKILNNVKIGKKVAEKSTQPNANVVARKKNAAVRAQQRAQRDQARNKARAEQRAAHEAKIMRRAGVSNFATDEDEQLKASYRRMPGDEIVQPWGPLGGAANAESVNLASLGRLALRPRNPIPSAAAVAASITRFASGMTDFVKNIVLSKAAQASKAAMGTGTDGKRETRRDAASKAVVVGDTVQNLTATSPVVSLPTTQTLPLVNNSGGGVAIPASLAPTVLPGLPMVPMQFMNAQKQLKK